jgi:hypothetical protein
MSDLPEKPAIGALSGDLTGPATLTVLPGHGALAGDREPLLVVFDAPSGRTATEAKCRRVIEQMKATTR